MLRLSSYGDRNLTKLFGVKTALQAFNKLHEIKVLISSGENPFLDDSLKVDDLITRYFSRLKSENSRSKYVEIHSYVYSKHIKPIIGHLFIDKVTPEHINRIIHNMRTQSLSSASIRKVKTILNPIFQEAFLNENIKRNILNLAKFVKKGSGISAKGSKEILTQRLEEPLENAVKKLFHAATHITHTHYRAAFLLSIMCARRSGEILKLAYEDIDFTNNVVRVRAEITKTHVNEHYPLPIEVKEALQPTAKSKGEIFSFWDTTFYENYKKNVVTKSGVELLNGKKITSHDNRTFFLSIGRRKFDYELVDKALSHKHGTIAEIYTAYEDNELKKVYDAYWELLRMHTVNL